MRGRKWQQQRQRPPRRPSESSLPTRACWSSRCPAVHRHQHRRQRPAAGLARGGEGPLRSVVAVVAVEVAQVSSLSLPVRGGGRSDSSSSSCSSSEGSIRGCALQGPCEREPLEERGASVPGGASSAFRSSGSRQQRGHRRRAVREAERAAAAALGRRPPRERGPRGVSSHRRALERGGAPHGAGADRGGTPCEGRGEGRGRRRSSKGGRNSGGSGVSLLSASAVAASPRSPLPGLEGAQPTLGLPLRPARPERPRIEPDRVRHAAGLRGVGPVEPPAAAAPALLGEQQPVRRRREPVGPHPDRDRRLEV